jgi:hypothetical protein
MKRGLILFLFFTENMFGGIPQSTLSQNHKRCCPETTPKMIHKIEVLELSMGEVRKLSPDGKLLQILAKWCPRPVESPHASE